MDLKKLIHATPLPSRCALLFFILGVACICISFKGPVKDFGNYYYGSRLFMDGKFSTQVYRSIHYFNSQVAGYGQTDFFGNYIPVPPFSVLIYLPFCLLNIQLAKLCFNLIGLLLFCLSFYRLLLSRKESLNGMVMLLPFLFLYPLFQNLSQGQAYLLIAALFMEAFLLSERGKIVLPALYMAFCISLKVFPIAVLLFFLFRKNFKLFFLSLGFTAVLFFISACAVGFETVAYYVSNILPRLYNNDIIGPYYPGNQSVYTALLGLFSHDALNNPSPLLESRLLIVTIDSLFAAFILLLASATGNKDSLLSFAVVIAACLLLSKYNTSYSLILLAPVALAICLHTGSWTRIVLLLLLFVAVSVPVTRFLDSPFVFKYARLICLLLVFFIFVFACRLSFRLPLLLLIAALIFTIKYLTFPVRNLNYFYAQNSRGILYDLKLKNDSILLVSTLGMRDSTEAFKIQGKAVEDPALVLKENRLYYNNRLLDDAADNKSAPFIYNDTAVVFMSDLNQGLGFYKLRSVSLNPKP